MKHGKYLKIRKNQYNYIYWVTLFSGSAKVGSPPQIKLWVYTVQCTGLIHKGAPICDLFILRVTYVRMSQNVISQCKVTQTHDKDRSQLIHQKKKSCQVACFMTQYGVQPYHMAPYADLKIWRSFISKKLGGDNRTNLLH